MTKKPKTIWVGNYSRDSDQRGRTQASGEENQEEARKNCGGATRVQTPRTNTRLRLNLGVFLNRRFDRISGNRETKFLRRLRQEVLWTGPSNARHYPDSAQRLICARTAHVQQSFGRRIRAVRKRGRAA